MFFERAKMITSSRREVRAAVLRGNLHFSWFSVNWFSFFLLELQNSTHENQLYEKVVILSNKYGGSPHLRITPLGNQRFITAITRYAGNFGIIIDALYPTYTNLTYFCRPLSLRSVQTYLYHPNLYLYRPPP